jgi:signal transduction histidine kinase
MCADGRKQFLHVIKLPVVGPTEKLLAPRESSSTSPSASWRRRRCRQSSKELQERNDELARFTYTASHDLKSPLVTIKAFLGYLEQDTLQPGHGEANEEGPAVHLHRGGQDDPAVG